MLGYLFYSHRCESSANFIRIIQTEGIQNLFNIIDIDKMSTDQIIKLGIKFTPMVVLKNNNNSGNSNQSVSHEGKNAFQWLNNLIEFRRQNMIKMAETERNRIIKATRTQNDNVLCYKPLETSGISDIFAYVDVDHYQPKSFMQYGQDVGNKIVTFQDNQAKISERETQSKINEYNKNRKVQDSQIESMIQNNLKETLINKIQTK
jgi:hypothetical protein